MASNGHSKSNFGHHFLLGHVLRRFGDENLPCNNCKKVKKYLQLSVTKKNLHFLQAHTFFCFNDTLYKCHVFTKQPNEMRKNRAWTIDHKGFILIFLAKSKITVRKGSKKINFFLSSGVLTLTQIAGFYNSIKFHTKMSKYIWTESRHQ